MVKFISYSGKFPQLCDGVLVIEVDNIVYTLPKHLLRSGGFCEWDGQLSKGAWSIYENLLPDNLLPFKDEIVSLINKNVPQGCCGGCAWANQ